MSYQISDYFAYADFRDWLKRDLQRAGRITVTPTFIDAAWPKFIKEIHPFELVADSMYHKKTGKRLIEREFSRPDDFIDFLATELDAKWHRDPSSRFLIFEQKVKPPFRAAW